MGIEVRSNVYLGISRMHQDSPKAAKMLAEIIENLCELIEDAQSRIRRLPPTRIVIEAFGECIMGMNEFSLSIIMTSARVATGEEVATAAFARSYDRSIGGARYLLCDDGVSFKMMIGNGRVLHYPDGNEKVDPRVFVEKAYTLWKRHLKGSYGIDVNDLVGG